MLCSVEGSGYRTSPTYIIWIFNNAPIVLSSLSIYNYMEGLQQDSSMVGSIMKQRTAPSRLRHDGTRAIIGPIRQNYSNTYTS